VSVPLHFVAATEESVSSEQDAARQVVSAPCFAHAPPAAQLPVLPQVFGAAAGHMASGVLTGTGPQIPVPAAHA
jgi:hypothetical protein